MKYIHKKSGNILTLKKSYGSVGVFYCEPRQFTKRIKIDTCVCLMSNVEPITENQQVLNFI